MLNDLNDLSDLSDLSDAMRDELRRGCVEAWASAGIPHEEIARRLGIGVSALRQNFSEEITFFKSPSPRYTTELSHLARQGSRGAELLLMAIVGTNSHLAAAIKFQETIN